MPEGRNETKNEKTLWVVVGDIHDETGNFAKIPELAQACGIIVSGDLTQFGGVEEAQKVIAALSRRDLPILAQIGNMDKPEIDDWLNTKGINIHTHVRELAPGLGIFGIGASTPTPFHTPSEFPEKTYAHWLRREWEEAGKFPHTVLVSHNPPRDTVCDALPNGMHVGSVAVREFLENAGPNGPDVCLCGHIHEGRGTDHVGRTLVVNPGTLASGGYAILEYADGKLDARLGQVRP